MTKKTEFKFSYLIMPVKLVSYNINALLGKSNENLIKNLITNKSGKRIAKMVYTNILELMNNAIENSKKKDKTVEVNVKINSEYFEIKVKNFAEKDKYLLLKEHIKKIIQHNDSKKMLALVLNKNRANKKKSGIGLIRLAAENKAVLSVSYNKSNSYITVKSKIII